MISPCLLILCSQLAAAPGPAPAVPGADAPGGQRPLNLNLERVALPPESDDRLLKILLIGDSQMGQSGNRLAGQVQKWDVDIVGRLLSCEYQGSAGVLFTSVTGGAYGAILTSTRIALGDDHGDGNTGSHFHHSRRFGVLGSIQPDFSALGTIGMLPGAPTRPADLDSRKNARVAIYDRPGGFTRFRLSEIRGGTQGDSTDYGLPADPGPELTGAGVVRWFNHTIRPAGELGSAGQSPVGIVYKDSDALDSDRSLHTLGALIHNSPSGTDFPDHGLVVAHISQSGWSAYDHLHTLNEDAIDAAVQMAEGFDTVMIVLGHNREDDFNASTNPNAYPINMKALADRITARHLANAFDAPDVVMVAPWPLGTPALNVRIATQTHDLHELCADEGYGFINLFDFFGGQSLGGVMDTPRGQATYVMDAAGTHPNDTATASNLMLDIEWNFDPSNWVIDCPPDLAEPYGTLNFFDLAAYIALYTAQDPGADLAAPFGTFNFFDLAAYIGSYNAGCP